MPAIWLTALVNGLIAGIGITLLALCFVHVFRRFSAATRYGMWWAVFAIAAVLPVAMYVRAKGSELSSARFEPVPAAVSPAPENRVEFDTPREPAQQRTVIYTSDATGPTVHFPLELHTNAHLAPWIGLAWVLFVAYGAARLLREGVLLRRFRERCFPADPELERRLRVFLQRTATRRRATVVLSTEISGPVAFGLARPVIALPAMLVSQLSGLELDNILLHELAHLRRRDDWARLLQLALETVFFFHPAILFISRKLNLEREIACDDWVIAVTGQPREYASCLTRIVELAGFRRGWALATGAAETKSHLVRRIELMLDKTRNRAPRASRLALLFIAIIAMVVAVGAGGLPSVLAFTTDFDQDDPPAPPAPPALTASPSAPATPAIPAVPAAPDSRVLSAYAAPAAPPEPAVPAAPAGAPAPPEPMAPPAPAAPPAPLGEEHWHSSWRDNGYGMDMWVDGVLEFADDDRDVKTLSPYGRFAMEIRSGGDMRRYEVRADGNGNLTRSYLVDGRARSLEEARPWLAGTLPGVIRETAIGAGPRIQRIAQRSGTTAAIREIGLIKSDHSRRIYIQEMLNRVRLDDGQLGESMRLVRGMGSDGEKTQTILAVSPKYRKTGLRESMFEAIDTINSDGEHRRALSGVLESDTAKETALLASKSAARIASDGEKAAILVQIAKVTMASDDTRRAWLKAAGTIASDGEKRRVLSAMLSADGRMANVGPILHVASQINSDGEKANVLIQAAPYYADSDAVRRPFFEAVNSIQSDGEHARVLMTVLEHNSSAATLGEATRSAQRISSDGEKAKVLTRIARENLNDASTRSGFFDAVNSIQSDGEHARALLTLVGRSGLPDELVIASIHSAAKINSDGEKTRVMARIAENYGRSRAVGQELRTAAKSITSDGEYRRLITMLDRQNPTI